MNTLYPTKSEYCIRLTGSLYDYARAVKKQYYLAVHSSDTRKKAEASKKAAEFRKVVKKLHPEFFSFTDSIGCDTWILEEHAGNLYIICYKKQ